MGRLGLLLTALPLVWGAEQTAAAGSIGSLFGRAKTSVAQTLEKKDAERSNKTDWLQKLGSKLEDKVKKQNGGNNSFGENGDAGEDREKIDKRPLEGGQGQGQGSGSGRPQRPGQGQGGQGQGQGSGSGRPQRPGQGQGGQGQTTPWPKGSGSTWPQRPEKGQGGQGQGQGSGSGTPARPNTSGQGSGEGGDGNGRPARPSKRPSTNGQGSGEGGDGNGRPARPSKRPNTNGKEDGQGGTGSEKPARPSKRPNTNGRPGGRNTTGINRPKPKPNKGSRNKTKPYQIKENQGKKNKTGKRRRPKMVKEWFRSEADASCDSTSEFQKWERTSLSTLCTAASSTTTETCICIRKAGRSSAKVRHICGRCVNSFKPTKVDGKDLNKKN